MNAAAANDAILALSDTFAVHRPNNDTVCGLVRTGVRVVKGPEPRGAPARLRSVDVRVGRESMG